MNISIKITSSVLIATLLFTLGCKKTSSPVTGGGTGGSAILVVTAEHANAFIDSCKFYIKYGTTDAPADGVYDDSLTCHPTSASDTTPIATFRGLTRGLYYLYGVGYHVGYTPPFVRGGLPCTIYGGSDSTHIFVPTYSSTY